MSILKKGLVLIAVPLCFQVAFIASVGMLRWSVATAEGWLIHTKNVFVQSRVVQAAMLSGHGALQGYVITRDSDFFKRAANEIQRTDDEASRLTRMVDDNTQQRALADVVERDVRQFTAFLREGMGLINANQLDALRTTERRRTAQRLLDQTNQNMAIFLATEQRIEDRREAQLARVRTQLGWFLAAGLVVSILASVVVATLFAQNVSGRIWALVDNTQRLAEGKELAPNLGGNDEIAALDRVFHEMAATLDRAAKVEREHARVMAARADELAALNAQLEEKSGENEMFVYSVSHDLRSPLVNLQGFSKELGLIGKDLRTAVDRDDVPPAIRHRAVGLIDGDVTESITFIQTAVSRLSGIIDALLRLSRAGRVEYRAQVCDVDAIVRRVVGALGQTISDKEARVTVGDLGTAHADPTAVEQIFGNLVGNALNYLDPARPGEIRIEQDRSDNPLIADPESWSVYAVRDNGLGIAEAYKTKVFAAFQRLHGDVAKGEGIGLALTRRVVERLGGKIWFESVAGRGSTFYVALPSGEVRSREEEASLVSS